MDSSQRKPQRKEGDEGYDPYDFEKGDGKSKPADKGTPDVETASKKRRTDGDQETPTKTPIAEERLKIFKTSLFEVFKAERSQSVVLDKIREFVNKQHSDAPFDENELMAAINKMMDDNQIMLADNVVFLI